MDEAVSIVHQWMRCSSKFITDAILAPYNAKHGTHYHLTSKQQEACDELDKLVAARLKRARGEELTEEEQAYARKLGISIMSGRGIGKSAWASWIIIWFLCCFDRAIVPCTASTAKQLKSVLWKEIHAWLKDSAVADWLVWQSEKVFQREHKGAEWYAIARTTNTQGTAEAQAETLSGYHGENMMIVIDEASGIPEPVFRPLEGTLTGQLNFIVMLFNPTRRLGYAIESHTKYRDNWLNLHWNAEECELVSPDQIERMAQKYGRDSNPYRISVKGLPPMAETDALIPWEWITDAQERDFAVDPKAPKMMGVDVGAGGDKSIVLIRQGNVVLTPIKKYDTPDTIRLAHYVQDDIDNYEPDFVGIDVIGLGNGVYGWLREAKYKVHPVDVRNKPHDTERFFSRRDELWWKVRERFEARDISIPADDDELRDHLASMKFDDSTGKVKIESKQSIRKRLGESPDKGDALMMTYAQEDRRFRKHAESQYDAYENAKDRLKRNEGSWMAA